jgi:hypothetical protein
LLVDGRFEVFVWIGFVVFGLGIRWDYWADGEGDTDAVTMVRYIHQVEEGFNIRLLVGFPFEDNFIFARRIKKLESNVRLLALSPD